MEQIDTGREIATLGRVAVAFSGVHDIQVQRAKDDALKDLKPRTRKTKDVQPLKAHLAVTTSLPPFIPILPKFDPIQPSTQLPPPKPAHAPHPRTSSSSSSSSSSTPSATQRPFRGAEEGGAGDGADGKDGELGRGSAEMGIHESSIMQEGFR